MILVRRRNDGLGGVLDTMVLVNKLGNDLSDFDDFPLVGDIADNIDNVAVLDGEFEAVLCIESSFAEESGHDFFIADKGEDLRQVVLMSLEAKLKVMSLKTEFNLLVNLDHMSMLAGVVIVRTDEFQDATKFLSRNCETNMGVLGVVLGRFNGDGGLGITVLGKGSNDVHVGGWQDDCRLDDTSRDGDTHFRIDRGTELNSGEVSVNIGSGNGEHVVGDQHRGEDRLDGMGHFGGGAESDGKHGESVRIGYVRLVQCWKQVVIVELWKRMRMRKEE